MYHRRLVLLLFGILVLLLLLSAVSSSSSMTKQQEIPSEEAQGVQAILAALTDAEQKALSDPEMPLRHFRAENGDTKKATKQVKATLAWRKEFQLETLRDCYEKSHQQEEAEATTCDSGDGSESTSATTTKTKITTAKEFRAILWEENETAKVYVRGYDTQGRAVVYLRPGLENTGHERNNMRHLVWNMEKAIAISERNGHSKIVFVVDFEGFSLFHTTTPMSTAQLTVEIFQKHYPERCHKFFITHPPFVFKAFWSAIQVFIDPTTKQKIVFCSGKSGTAQLRKELGGGNHEECAGGDNNNNIKQYDRQEYFQLSLDENFDDENWPQFNKKSQNQ